MMRIMRNYEDMTPEEQKKREKSEAKKKVKRGRAKKKSRKK